MMHALLASTQEDRMSDGGKREGTRGRDRDRESISVSQDYFLLKIIPCFPVGTHTQTPPQPSVLSLSISIKETSLFIVSWQAERAGRGAIVCKEAQCWSVDGGGDYRFERRWRFGER